MSGLKDELRELYADASKHSVYQNVPDFVSAELGYSEVINESWRGDRPRLRYVLGVRVPHAGETWLDFGANTGFFTLSLARQFPDAQFVAVEANVNHARFIERVAAYFSMENVQVLPRAVGLLELDELPSSDFLLHFNVLHHAGHDFDRSEVPDRGAFPAYARSYLGKLRASTRQMLFQMGSNWGGDKGEPLVGPREDAAKLQLFLGWLADAGWTTDRIAYASRAVDGAIGYADLPLMARECLLRDPRGLGAMIQSFRLDEFPGEFYRRPLISCKAANC